MSGNLLDLAKRLEARAETLDEDASRIAVEVATAVVTDLIQVTPVDTSRALSNWIVTLGAFNNYSIFAYYPGVFGSTRGSSAAAAIAEAVRVLATKKPGVPIWITNNLRYIRPLNEGHSKQEPAGFVERAALKGRNIAKAAKLRG
jgi:hypothetical protein